MCLLLSLSGFSTLLVSVHCGLFAATGWLIEAEDAGPGMAPVS